MIGLAGRPASLWETVSKKCIAAVSAWRRPSGESGHGPQRLEPQHAALCNQGQGCDGLADRGIFTASGMSTSGSLMARVVLRFTGVDGRRQRSSSVGRNSVADRMVVVPACGARRVARPACPEGVPAPPRDAPLDAPLSVEPVGAAQATAGSDTAAALTPSATANAPHPHHMSWMGTPGGRMIPVRLRRVDGHEDLPAELIRKRYQPGDALGAE